jgi:toxin ParE1/3/4
MIAQHWRVRLGAIAEVDFANILKWTVENFGRQQAAVYRDILVQTIGELTKGPHVSGSRARDDIMPGLRTLHVARHGRRGRHFLLYRIVEDGIIEIGRILHDQMDLQRHLPPSPEESDDGSA